jgi:hypothetical protein
VSLRAGRLFRPSLGLEFLEGRTMPAVIVTPLYLDGDGASDDLRIVGDAGNNAVTITDDGTGALLVSIDANRDGDTTDYGEFSNAAFNFSGNTGALEINLGAGNDAVTYNQTGSFSGDARSLSINLGSGNNTATVAAETNDIFAASRFDLDVTGGGGNDTLNVALDEVRASLVSVRASLGLGNDAATLAFDRIDDKAAVDLDASLGDGLNYLQIDPQEIGFGDRADVHVDIHGGAQKDTVAVNLHDDVGNGVSRSSLQIDAELFAGNDSFTAGLDYAGNVFRVDDHSLASIAVRGGSGDDTLGVQGVGAAGTIKIDPDGLLDIDLKGGAGNDTVGVNLGKSDALEVIDGVRIRMDGGIGNDSLSCLLANNAASTGSFDVAVLGGAGSDSAVFALPPAGTPTFGPLGKVLFDGGRGLDTLTNANPAASLVRFFETVL